MERKLEALQTLYKEKLCKKLQNNMTAVLLLVIGRGKEVKIEKCSARASHENLP
jgi:hypothetical protein